VTDLANLSATHQYAGLKLLIAAQQWVTAWYHRSATTIHGRL